MLHNYGYSVVYIINGVKQTRTGRLTNLHSEGEARAYLQSHYSGVISIEVWEV